MPTATGMVFGLDILLMDKKLNLFNVSEVFTLVKMEMK